ncbi:beta-galactosidase family GH35 [Gracilaria domingensis]|nr:beta-galactosidase family GH35 [Gracilaria domingensis]
MVGLIFVQTRETLLVRAAHTSAANAAAIDARRDAKQLDHADLTGRQIARTISGRKCEVQVKSIQISAVGLETGARAEPLEAAILLAGRPRADGRVIIMKEGHSGTGLPGNVAQEANLVITAAQIAEDGHFAQLVLNLHGDDAAVGVGGALEGDEHAHNVGHVLGAVLVPLLIPLLDHAQRRVGHVAHAQVALGDEPDGEAARLHLGADVRARGDDDEELELGADVEQVGEVAVAAKVVHALGRAVVPPVDVEAHGVEAHGLDVGQNGAPSARVRHAEVVELGGDDGHGLSVEQQRGLGPVQRGAEARGVVRGNLGGAQRQRGGVGHGGRQGDAGRGCRRRRRRTQGAARTTTRHDPRGAPSHGGCAAARAYLRGRKAMERGAHPRRCPGRCCARRGVRARPARCSSP